MMHTIWMRLFVTSLMLLGDYAYSSDVNDRFDIDVAASDNPVQSYQSVLLDDDGTQWAPSLAGHNAIRPSIRFAPQTTLSIVSRFPDSAHRYNSFDPRAPPVSAG
jgi:hypothetical protein